MLTVISSERLNFREIIKSDIKDLTILFKDSAIMYAWEHSFTNDEIIEWIKECRRRYKDDGISYYYVSEKATENFVGIIGLLMEEADGEREIGVGYILDKRY